MRRLFPRALLWPLAAAGADTAVQVAPEQRDQTALYTDGKGHYATLVPGGALPQGILG